MLLRHASPPLDLHPHMPHPFPACSGVPYTQQLQASKRSATLCLCRRTGVGSVCLLEAATACIYYLLLARPKQAAGGASLRRVMVDRVPMHARSPPPPLPPLAYCICSGGGAGDHRGEGRGLSAEAAPVKTWGGGEGRGGWVTSTSSMGGGRGQLYFCRGLLCQELVAQI